MHMDGSVNLQYKAKAVNQWLSIMSERRHIKEAGDDLMVICHRQHQLNVNTVNPGKPEKGDMSVVQSCSWRRGIKVGIWWWSGVQDGEGRQSAK